MTLVGHDHEIIDYHARLMQWLYYEHKDIVTYFAQRQQGIPNESKNGNDADDHLRELCSPTSIAEWRENHKQRIVMDDDIVKRNYFHLLDVKRSVEVDKFISDAQCK